MPQTGSKRFENASFEFRSGACAPEALFVVRFTGSEGLGALFEFEILLATRLTALDLVDVVQSPAFLSLKSEQGDNVYEGILAYFEQVERYEGLTFYRACLRPKLWWLTLTYHNQIFLGKTSPQILAAVLADAGLDSKQDFELRLSADYPAWEYVCQYGETHFEFISRWMERDGMYYFFEQQTGKLILTDTPLAHVPLTQSSRLVYAPTSGLDLAVDSIAVREFSCRQQIVPSSVAIKDYNYRAPALEAKGGAAVDPYGCGDVYVYGEHVRSPSEASSLAAIRAQEFLCRQRQYVGASDIPFVRAGYTFSLEQHYREDMNQEYAIIEARHEGGQGQYLVSALGLRVEENEGDYYRNSFTAIPAAQQFRAERTTAKPRFHGTLSAHIDAMSSGAYAEVDDQGRYKVILPFDLSGRDGGKASAWLRMMQPYAGSDHGMHFPLHKGTEVLLAFIDGSPDRPVIVGAVPNPSQKSLVAAENQTRCVLATSGGNKMHMENKQGQERILFQTPLSGAFLRIGTPNDPPCASSGWSSSDDMAGVVFNSSNAFDISAGSENTVVMIENSCNVIGGDWHKTVVGLGTEINLAAYFVYHDPWEHDWTPLRSWWVGRKLKFIGALNQKVLDENIQTIGEIKKLEQLKIKMTAETNALKAQETAIAGEVTKLTPMEQTLTAELTQLNQLKNTLVQEEQTLTAETTQMNNEVTEMKQSVVEITATRQELTTVTTQLTDSKTELGTMKTHLQQNWTEMVEDYNTLATLITKI